MAFITDQQTLDDLNLVGKYKPNSVFSLFNKVCTAGGERLLEQMFREPLTTLEEINDRTALFRYFQEKQLRFPFEREESDVLENFLLSGGGRSFLGCLAHTARRSALNLMGLHREYTSFNDTFAAAVKLIRRLYSFLQLLQDPRDTNPFSEKIAGFIRLLNSDKLRWLLEEENPAKAHFIRVAGYDHQLREVHRKDMKELLELLYLVDLCIAVAGVAKARDLCYAEALPANAYTVSVTKCRHPAIPGAVGNSLTLNGSKNVLFLTGANMAGKSTFMKSYAIALYLAHMGFPVAAEQMRFSLRDGLFTSINVPDNLNMGYSHFYAEVLRVRMVAEVVAAGKNMLVIFDELFKGTNVKDAYDATLAVTKAFSEYRNSAFIISTHIIEVGAELGEQCANVQFAYLPTIVDEAGPTYTYRLQEGITSDRHGMMIIENEKILEKILPGKDMSLC